MRALLVTGCLALLLACGGLPTPDPEPIPAPDPSPPPRQTPEGEIEPVQFVTLRFGGSCQVQLSTVPKGDVKSIGTLPGPCPTRALLAWKPGKIMLSDEAGLLHELGTNKDLADLPVSPGGLGPEGMAFDAEGRLHACGPTDVAGTGSDDKHVAEYRDQKLEASLPAVAIGSRVQVRWELQAGRWVEKGWELVPHLFIDRMPDCFEVDGFPYDSLSTTLPSFADSDGALWTGSEWEPAPEEDMAALKAMHEGYWLVDATRTVAVMGSAGDSPYAAFVSGAWQLVYPAKDARGLWLTRDFLGIRDSSGGFRWLSRRDGSTVFEQADKTLSFPWPRTAILGSGEPTDGEPREGKGKKTRIRPKER